MQQMVIYEACRLPPPPAPSAVATTSMLRDGDTVEVWCKPEVDHGVHAWHSAQVVNVKASRQRHTSCTQCARVQGEFVVVQKLTGAHSKEIVSLDSIRPQSRRQPLKPANFKAKSFVVPEDLRHE